MSRVRLSQFESSLVRVCTQVLLELELVCNWVKFGQFHRIFRSFLSQFESERKIVKLELELISTKIYCLTLTWLDSTIEMPKLDFQFWMKKSALQSCQMICKSWDRFSRRSWFEANVAAVINNGNKHPFNWQRSKNTFVDNFARTIRSIKNNNLEIAQLGI